MAETIRWVVPTLFALTAACAADDHRLAPETALDAGSRSPDAQSPDAASVEPRAYGGLISVQDVSIVNAPELGHGLTVIATFTEARVPDYEETPGQPTGCKVWSYDMRDNPMAPLTDQGVLTIRGAETDTIACHFTAAAGYECPTASGSGGAIVKQGERGAANYDVNGATFFASNAGRYLRVTGASHPSNNGSFPVLGVPSPSELVVLNSTATAEGFEATFALLAGAGPVPNDSVVVYPPGDGVTVSLAPGGGNAFEFADIGPVVPGGAFTLDAASRSLLAVIPLDGSALTLRCEECAPAAATVIRMTTTDGATAGVPAPFMPSKAARKQVELQCATLGGDGSIVIPAEAMRFVRDAHRASPITRIRTAFMREGVAFGTNPEPLLANRATVLAGHGMLGFSDP